MKRLSQMEDKFDKSFLENVEIDSKRRIIRIKLNPMLYPRTVVMRASYSFTDGFDIAVDGDGANTIVVIRVGALDDVTKSDFDDIIYRFYSELIHASVEETQARRYADTRNALIGAALKSIIPPINSSGNKINDKDEKSTVTIKSDVS